jgi:hypothetical protein
MTQWTEEKDQEMATFMHDTLCRKDHIQDCAWGWEKSWSNSVHKRYLETAKQLRRMSVHDLTMKHIIRSISKL